MARQLIINIQSLKERLEDTSKKLGIEEVRTKLIARFVRINRQKEKNEDELGFQAVEKNSHCARIIAGNMDILTGNVHKNPRAV